MNRVSNAISGRLANMLKQRLSERTKRILFIGSLSAQLNDPSKLNGEMLHKLNTMLELAADDAALKFPVHLSQVIWRNRPLEEGVRLSLRSESLPLRVHALGIKVLASMPSWMRYGDEKRMLTDFEDLMHWQHGRA